MTLDLGTLAQWGLKVASWLAAWWNKHAHASSPRRVPIGMLETTSLAAAIRAEVK
jgi:hypothetical protein